MHILMEETSKQIGDLQYRVINATIIGYNEIFTIPRIIIY